MTTEGNFRGTLMSTSEDDGPADIDLRSVASLVRKSLLKVLLLSGLVAAATFGVLSTMAPRFSSEAMIAIISKASNNPYSDPSRAGQSNDLTVRMDKEAVNTHVSALRSADLAQAVANSLSLKDKVEFNSALGAPDAFTAFLNSLGIGLPRSDESEDARVLNTFAKRLEVYSPKESRSIGIRFSSSDPELAAKAANGVAEAYRAALATQSIQETDDVQRALETKIATLSEEASEAERAVEKFRGEANIFKGGQQQTGLNEQQLAELNAELSRVKAARSEAEARAKQAREILDGGSADALPDVQKSPLIQSLVQSRVRLERQISELSATLLPGHPRMRQLNADLAGLKTQLKTEISKVVDSLAKEAKVAAIREESVSKSVSDIKKRIVNTGPDEARLRGLEADARSKRAELERLRSQYEANRVRADDARAVPVEVQIVSTARPASVPVFPKKTASAALSGVATILIGLALVITRGLISGSARVGTPARRYQRAEPRLQTPGFSRGANTAEAWADATEHRGERSGTAAPAQQAAKGKHAHRLAAKKVAPSQITSRQEAAERLEAVRKRGLAGARTLMTAKTDKLLAAEALGLARELAERGSTVIIIDWSLNAAGISAALGQPASPGIVELVKDRASFEQVVVPLEETGVHLIPAGQGRGEAGDDIEPGEVNAILDALDGVYDHILVAALPGAAEPLFEAIEGRFDCGITISGPDQSAVAAPGVFLGFEVDGLDLLTYAPRAHSSFAGRLARAS